MCYSLDRCSQETRGFSASSTEKNDGITTRHRRCLLFLLPPLLQPPLPLPFPLLFPLTIVSPLIPPPCPCSPVTLDPEPAKEIPTSNPSTKVGGREGGRDWRRAMRIAWEKLVRWSWSWRSKAKSDVLELSAKAEMSARYGFRILLGVRDALRWSGCCFRADRLSMALRRDEAEVRSSAANAKAVVIEGVGVAGGGWPWSALVPYCSQPREAPEICSLDPSSRTFYL